MQNQNFYIVFLIQYCIFETDKFLNWNQCNKKILIILGQFEFAKACLQFLLQTLKKKGGEGKKRRKRKKAAVEFETTCKEGVLQLIFARIDLF